MSSRKFRFALHICFVGVFLKDLLRNIYGAIWCLTFFTCCVLSNTVDCYWRKCKFSDQVGKGNGNNHGQMRAACQSS